MAQHQLTNDLLTELIQEQKDTKKELIKLNHGKFKRVLYSAIANAIILIMILVAGKALIGYGIIDVNEFDLLLNSFYDQMFRAQL